MANGAVIGYAVITIEGSSVAGIGVILWGAFGVGFAAGYLINNGNKATLAGTVNAFGQGLNILGLADHFIEVANGEPAGQVEPVWDYWQ